MIFYKILLNFWENGDFGAVLVPFVLYNKAN